jgi:arylsulfatase
LTTDLVDRAIGWMRTQKSIEPQKPFLLYLATGAMHAPHHAPREMIDAFKGKFDAGWDRYREEAFRKQKQLGVIPANTKLTPRPPNIPAWDGLSKEEQHLLAYQMEIFAAFGAHTDREIGRLLSAVNTLPDADNTLVIYIVGDNGASAEGGRLGDVNEIGSANGLLPESTEDFTPEIMAGLGGPKYNNNFSRGWGWAMNTPFQYYKQVISHLGAIRNPLIVSWPARIQRDNTVRSQFLHVTDIAPTILDAAGIDKPDSVNGIAQKPMDGVSLLGTYAKADVGELRRTQHFEVFGNRAIYHDGWMASAPLSTTTSSADRSALHPDQAIWELYKLDDDFSQSDNLASRYPEKLRQLQDLWWARAGQSNVLPLDWRSGERLIGNARPNPLRGRDQIVFYPGMAALPEAISPSIRNRSWSISAHGKFSPQSQGMLVTQGGMSGGWALYIQDGHLVFDYNYGSLAEYQVKSDTPLPAEAKVLEARFLYDGKTSGERGLGGLVTLWADGRKIGAGRLDKTISNLFSMTDGLDVGADYGSPVTSHYPMPFPVEGELERVEVHLT